MTPKQLKPITLQLGLSYTFDPVDHLPDDWQGTREDAIEQFRSDIAENLHSWANPRDIYNCIRETKPDLTPELLSALKGFPDLPDDYHKHNTDAIEAFVDSVNCWKRAASAAIAKAETTTT